MDMSEEQNKKRILKNIAKKKVVLCAGGAIFAFILLGYIGVRGYYYNRWEPHTYINGMDVSGRTFEQSLQLVEDYVKNYTLEIEGRDKGEFQILSDDINLQVEYVDEMKRIYDELKNSIHFLCFEKHEYDGTFLVTYDESKLKNSLSNCCLIKGSKDYIIQKPKSASIDYSEEKKCGIQIEEEQGNTLDQKKFYDLVEEALDNLDDKLNLTSKEGEVAYKKPKVSLKDEIFQNAFEKYNSYVLRWIVWDMGENTTECLSPEVIKDWVSVNSKCKVKLDENKVNAWVEEFCLKYKTQDTTRTFTTHDNKVIEVSGGDYGWRMDYTKMCQQAIKMIRKKIDPQAAKEYIEQASEEKQKKLTLNCEPIYSNRAFKKDYVDFQNDWDDQNYSEVDIQAQMVYVYQNGELAYSCNCVTGLLSDPERATRTGCYYIKDKKEDYVLVGADYETPTKYWVRIMWSGTGYHYLARSDWSRWTPEIYKTRGSHGCINLQMEDAKSVYDLVHLGDAVFIHN